MKMIVNITRSSKNLLKYSVVLNPNLFQCAVKRSFNNRAFSTKDYSKYPPNIEFSELKDKIMKGQITLIDVRSASEQKESGFIEGSINLPLTTLGTLVKLEPKEFQEEVGVAKPPRTAPLATMCVLGIRAQTAQLALLGAGYTDVRLYEGSFKDWQDKKGDIVFE